MNPDRRDSESRSELLDMVAAIDRRTLRMEVKLLDEETGFVKLTNDRLDRVEGRMWGAVIGALSAMFGVAWQLIRGKG